MVKDLNSAILVKQILDFHSTEGIGLVCNTVELTAFFFCLDVNSGIPLMHHRWSSTGFTFLLSFFFFPSHPLQSSHFSYLALSFWQGANDSWFEIVQAAFQPLQIFMFRERKRRRVKGKKRYGLFLFCWSLWFHLYGVILKHFKRKKS